MEVERKEIAEVQRDRIAVEKTVAQEQERIKDVQALSEAERQKSRNYDISNPIKPSPSTKPPVTPPQPQPRLLSKLLVMLERHNVEYHGHR